MLRILVAAAVPLAAALPANAAEQRFMVTDFDAIAASGAHKIVVTTGKSPSVRAVGDREDIDRLDVDVAGRTLRIGTKRSGEWLSWKHGGPVTIYVTTHDVRSARLAGSGDMAIDRMKGGEVKLGVAGSGDMNVGVIDARALDVSVAGSGDLAMTGKCENASVSVAGSGNVDAPGLKCQTLSGKVAGSGNIVIEASKTATVNVAGSGNVTVRGGAKCEVKTMGSGRVECGVDS
jgi:hypothetical protein